MKLYSCNTKYYQHFVLSSRLLLRSSPALMYAKSYHFLSMKTMTTFFIRIWRLEVPKVLKIIPIKFHGQTLDAYILKYFEKKTAVKYLVHPQFQKEHFSFKNA